MVSIRVSWTRSISLPGAMLWFGALSIPQVWVGWDSFSIRISSMWARSKSSSGRRQIFIMVALRAIIENAFPPWIF